MPDVNAYYLISYLFEIGPIQTTGMGTSPITYAEIQTWMNLVGLDLQPWEIRFLKKLSCDYLNESHMAEKSDRPPAWDQQKWVQEQRNAISNRVQNALRARMIKKRSV